MLDWVNNLNPLFRGPVLKFEHPFPFWLLSHSL